MLANVDGVERGWGVGYIIPYYIKGLATASILQLKRLDSAQTRGSGPVARA